MEELSRILEKGRRNLTAVVGELSSKFGEVRVREALEAVEDRRVKLYVFNPSGRRVWIVVGRERDYLVLPSAGYCTCEDFYFNVLDGKARLCYHVIAQKIAEYTGFFDVVEAEDELYDRLVSEWKELRVKGKPRYLDRVEDIREAAAELIAETGFSSTESLYKHLVEDLGFRIPSKRSLAAILRMDPKRRFRFTGEGWRLQPPSET